ncbi:cytochrome P450 [Lentinula raphanica]|nr:cytochrome P450 [Lentinula raphanica]
MLFPVELLFLCWSVTVLFILVRFNKTRRSLPPGPLSLPYIGNLRYFISRPNWFTYTEWYQKYDSDIVHVNIAGSSYIILNSLEAATELLERRSGIYSSRWALPKFRMLADMIGLVSLSPFNLGSPSEHLRYAGRYKWSFVLMPYGPEWKAQRKLCTNMFNPNNPDEHESRELKATRIFLLKLHKSPDDLFQHLLDMAGSTILSIVYGFDVAAVQHSLHTVNAEEGAQGFLQASILGNFLVDDVPWLRYVPSWFPGASFQAQAQFWRKYMEKILHGPFDEMKNHFVSEWNISVSCVWYLTLAGPSPIRGWNLVLFPDAWGKLLEMFIKSVAASLYLGGTDTTVTTLKSFFLAMIQYPECQKKAQQELDCIIGRNRLPDFADKDTLPYIEAILHETMRRARILTQKWQPTTPAGLPHLVSEEDVYNGYRIPKNSIVITNMWAMMRDERNFKDPFTSNPDRYIRLADGQLDLDLLKRATAGFGFGRRICPGKHMALSAMWIAIASILSVFEISKAVDENGQVIEPSMKFKSTMLQNQPLAYKLSIKLRSPDCLRVMQTDVDFVEGK